MFPGFWEKSNCLQGSSGGGWKDRYGQTKGLPPAPGRQSLGIKGKRMGNENGESFGAISTKEDRK